MSAESLGRDLLGEVKEEGLDELLRSLRELANPPSAHLDYPPLDTLLSAFQNPPPTQQQQHHQTHPAPSSSQEPSPPPPRKKKPPPIIELTSTTPCSGKTQLLHHLIALSLLPSSHASTHHFGKQSAVILLDLSTTFSILRLHDIMAAHITSTVAPTGLPPQEISTIISTSLRHLHIFRPQSSSSLLSTLASSPAYLLAQPSPHISSNRPLNLIAVNAMDAFLPQDRHSFSSETETPTPYTQKVTSQTLTSHYQNLTTHLLTLQRLFTSTLLLTTTSLSPPTITPSPSPHSPNHLLLRPSLPTPLSTLPTTRLILTRTPVPKTSPGTSAQEAMAEQQQRWEAVCKSGFSGRVNWWGAEGWREEVRGAVGGWEGWGVWVFGWGGGGSDLEGGGVMGGWIGET